jgi:hypothetical protein
MSLKGRIVLPALFAAMFAAMAVSLVAAQVASASHPRPLSANKLQLSLVPAFRECTTGANRFHGPPLAGASCNPPQQTSDSVTIGGQSVGSIKIKVQPGTPGPPEDSDVLLTASSSDIRCRPAALPSTCGSANATGGADYVGGVEGNATIRITDHWNGVAAGGGSDPATVIDLPFPVVGTCTATASTGVGATCGVNTTANAVIGGPDPVVKDDKRANVEVTQIQIFDGGNDGQVGTVGDNDLLAVQGIFIP